MLPRLALIALVACGSSAAPEGLLEAHHRFESKIDPDARTTRKPVAMPPFAFQLVSYSATPGAMAAYVTPDPRDGKKHPAIVWIKGGEYQSIHDVWTRQPPENDQSAAQYRDAGVVMMFPSLRGGNDNPGRKEGFYGEVEDVLAAADYLAKLPYVDPAQLYLGGHSTGGTLVALVSAAAPKGQFRAVFSFGPTDSPEHYGKEMCPFDMKSRLELALRAPRQWLDKTHTPTFVFEGANQPSRVEELRLMAGEAKNPLVHYFPVEGATHFTVLAPINRLLAEKVLHNQVEVTAAEVAAAIRP